MVCCAVPRGALAVGLGLAVVSLVLAGLGLGFRASRLDLLNPHSAYNQRWLAYLDEFGREDDAVLVIEGTHRDVVVQTIDRVATALEQQPQHFRSILSRIDTHALHSKALHYLSPQDLSRVQQAILRLTPVIEGQWHELELSFVLRQWNAQATQLAHMPRSSESESQTRQLSRQLEEVLSGLNEALAGRLDQAPRLIPSLLDAPEHPLAQMSGDSDGHLLFDQGAPAWCWSDSPGLMRNSLPKGPKPSQRCADHP